MEQRIEGSYAEAGVDAARHAPHVRNIHEPAPKYRERERALSKGQTRENGSNVRLENQFLAACLGPLGYRE